MTESEARQRAELIIKAIDAKLARWRHWFPNEDSEVDVPRRDLLALKHFAEIGLRLTAEQKGEAS